MVPKERQLIHELAQEITEKVKEGQKLLDKFEQLKNLSYSAETRGVIDQMKEFLKK